MSKSEKRADFEQKQISALNTSAFMYAQDFVTVEDASGNFRTIRKENEARVAEMKAEAEERAAIEAEVRTEVEARHAELVKARVAAVADAKAADAVAKLAEQDRAAEKPAQIKA